MGECTFASNRHIMGHLTLKIRNNNTEKPYIVVDADYLHEVWVAEAFDENKTKIIKQFKCDNFRNCFKDLKSYIRGLGEVTDITADGIQDSQVEQLKKILAHNTDTQTVPENENHRSEFLFFNTKKVWEKLQKYSMRFIHP